MFAPHAIYLGNAPNWNQVGNAPNWNQVLWWHTLWCTTKECEGRQHSQLAQLLGVQGCEHVKMHIIHWGVAGAIYKGHSQNPPSMLYLLVPKVESKKSRNTSHQRRVKATSLIIAPYLPKWRVLSSELSSLLLEAWLIVTACIPCMMEGIQIC